MKYFRINSFVGIKKKVIFTNDKNTTIKDSIKFLFFFFTTIFICNIVHEISHLIVILSLGVKIIKFGIMINGFENESNSVMSFGIGFFFYISTNKINNICAFLIAASGSFGCCAFLLVINLVYKNKKYLPLLSLFAVLNEILCAIVVFFIYGRGDFMFIVKYSSIFLAIVYLLVLTLVCYYFLYKIVFNLSIFQVMKKYQKLK